MIRAMLFAALLTLSPIVAVPAFADDASDIRSAIASQLEAFKRNDKSEAYAQAAPNIQRMFPSPDAFMQMVETAYDPVYHSSNAVFGTLKAEGGGFRQEVNLTDTKGQSWIATYTLERQPDGSMKITGCAIRKGDDLAA